MILYYIYIQTYKQTYIPPNLTQLLNITCFLVGKMLSEMKNYKMPDEYPASNNEIMYQCSTNKQIQGILLSNRISNKLQNETYFAITTFDL